MIPHQLTNSGLARLQMRVLEALFPPGWFAEAKQPTHPAHRRWLLCRRILEQGGSLRLPAQLDDLGEYARLMLDVMHLVTITKGDMATLTPGALESFGDQAVQTKIRTRATNPSQFQDVMLELAICGWHLSEGHAVTPLELDGMPDIRLAGLTRACPLYVECKRLSSPSPKRIAKVLQKANNQVKHAGSGAFGVAILDVTAALAARKVADDTIPEPVVPAIEAARRALSGVKNRRISRALILWDDHLIIGAPPSRVSVFFRRRLAVVDHELVEGVCPIPADLPLFAGNTVFMGVNSDLSLSGVEELVIADSAKDFMQSFQLTESDALDAFRYRDKTQSLQTPGAAGVLFARRVTGPTGAEVLLGFVKRTGNTATLNYLIRVPNALCERLDMLTPLEMLAEVAEEFGFAITFGTVTSKFISYHSVRLEAVDEPKLFYIDAPSTASFVFSSSCNISQADGGYLVQCATVFCLDRVRLRRALGYSD